MPLRPRFILPFRASLITLAMAGCALLLSAAATAQTLTFTGQVYSPLGPAVTGSTAVHGDPIPNILVFVQDPNSPLPVFSPGVTVPASTETGCEAQPSLVPTTVYGSGLTDPTGTFTFNVASALPPTVTVVIQAGKWRRQYQYTAAQIASYTSGTTIALPAMSMPANQSQGDLPHIAVVTGSADDIECIFPQIGISTSEITDPTGSGSINLFSGNASSGEVVSTSSPTETQLVNPSAAGAIPISNYDMVIFGCQSWADGTTDTDVPLYAKNVEAYANEGGRVFGTHGEATWITTPADWSGIATFGGSTTSGGTQTGQLSTGYTGEPTLAAWMTYIGALNTPASSLQFSLTNVFYNLTAVNSPGETWVTLPDHSNAPNQFSFDTPIGAPGKPAVTLNFANQQTTFDLGQVGDSIVINVTNTGSAPTTAGLTLTLSIPSAISPTQLADSGSGNWTCVLSSPTSICTLAVPLAAGAEDGVTLTFDIPQTSPTGSATLVGTLTNGGINQTEQCGRVLYNDYHVEGSIASKSLFSKNACSTAAPTTLTNAQKFLEYSLYNLSNFVAPSTTDVLVIQAPTTTTITTSGNPGVQTPIFYGQIIGDTDGLNAIVSTSAPTGTNSGNLTVDVDNVLVCTLPNTGTGGTCPNAGFSGQNVGVHTVQAFYSGDTEYQPSSSPIYDVTVQQDPTSTALTTSATPVVYGTSLTFTATVTDQYATAVGTVNFYDGPTLLGAATLNSSGVATYTTTTLSVGTHQVGAVYVGGTNFVGSNSPNLTQVVTLPQSVTSTTLVSSVNPAYQAQNITFTATVVQVAFAVVVPAGLSNPLPTGTVNFFDGTTQIGSGTLTSAGVATFSTSTLTVGTHPITAVYVGDGPNGPSTSNVVQQVVNPNIFTLAVDPTSLTLATGSSASINITITDIGGFNEPVQLSCTGQIGENNCAFAELAVPAGGGTTRLTITPAAPHNCVTTTTSQNTFPSRGLPILAGGAFLLFLARKRRRLFAALTLAVALCALPLLNGCGTSGCTDFGVLPGTYTITVTATSAAPYALTQTQNVTLTVNP